MCPIRCGFRQTAVSSPSPAINQLNSETSAISQEQNRIRENLGKIDRTNELYKRYLTKLNEQETQLENINEQRVAAQQKLEQQRREFNEYLRGLNVE
jgi:chromosome segregation ATPase